MSATEPTLPGADAAVEARCAACGLDAVLVYRDGKPFEAYHPAGTKWPGTPPRCPALIRMDCPCEHYTLGIPVDKAVPVHGEWQITSSSRIPGTTVWTCGCGASGHADTARAAAAARSELGGKPRPEEGYRMTEQTPATENHDGEVESHWLAPGASWKCSCGAHGTEDTWRAALSAMQAHRNEAAS